MFQKNKLAEHDSEATEHSNNNKMSVSSMKIWFIPRRLEPKTAFRREGMLLLRSIYTPFEMVFLCSKQPKDNFLKLKSFQKEVYLQIPRDDILLVCIAGCETNLLLSSSLLLPKEPIMFESAMPRPSLVFMLIPRHPLCFKVLLSSPTEWQLFPVLRINDSYCE